VEHSKTAVPFRGLWARARGSLLWSKTRESHIGQSWCTTRRFVREFWSWAQSEDVILPRVEELTKSLQALCESATISVEGDSEAPIFLLATGWRTGSTLLQRILVTDPNVLIWGEPFGEMAISSRLADMISCFSKPPGIREWTANETIEASTLAQSWIANLTPPGEDFRLAVRRLFDQWLGEPARQRGYARWGLKEVRLGAVEAIFLHWLYPKAKFVCLSRHPYDCYRSLADSGWNDIYLSRPDVLVGSAAGLARHWNRLVLTLWKLPADFPAYHVKYEDVIERNFDFRKFESWLGIKIKEETALSVIVGHSSVRPRLGWHERWIIRSEASTGMQELGYSE